MANATFEIIRQNIKKYRNERNLSQVQLAMKCSLSSEYLSEIERGKRAPSLKRLFKIAEALGSEPHKLLMK